MKKSAITMPFALTALLVTVVAPPANAEDYASTSTDTLIPSRGVQIPATLVAPVGEADETFPLVVIHHGHGGGRNENGGMARVAEALATAGIASIRFDFAGAGDSEEPFTALSYTTMLADSDAALAYARENMPVDEERIGALGYSEGSAVVAMQAGQPDTSYQAVALMGPVAQPGELMGSFFGGPEAFEAYYQDAQTDGFADVTTPFGQVQATSLEWFDETIAADPVGDIGSFDGPVLIVWGEAEQIIPYGQVEAFQAATADSAAPTQVVTIPDADHGYGFYSEQPEVDAALHGALVDFFTDALGEEAASE